MGIFRQLLHSRCHNALLVVLFVLAAAIAWKDAVSQDLVHDISGVVKKVDKGTKTVVIKSADGTEQTIKYTDKTVVEGTKDAGKGVAKGSSIGNSKSRVTRNLYRCIE